MQGFLCLLGEKYSSPGLSGGDGLEMSRWDCRDQEMNSAVLGGYRRIMMIQFSILSLLPSFNIPPALKKESGLVLGILIVGWQKGSMLNVKVSFTLL